MRSNSKLLVSKNLFSGTTEDSYKQQNVFSTMRKFIPVLTQFTYLQFQIFPLKYKEVVIKQEKEGGLYFIFCSKGDVSILLENGKVKTLETFQNALYYDIHGKGLNIHPHVELENRFCIISFSPNKKESPFLIKNFTSYFDKYSHEEKNLFIGTRDFILFDKIKRLSVLSKNDFAGELIEQSLIYEILGYSFQKMLPKSNEIVHNKLSWKVRKKIMEVATEIRLKPEMKYTVTNLCNKAGLTPAKLQQGFRMQFHTTVIDYLKQVRLEKAIELMNTTDLNISEIVYSIGFTSRSYFSKIFKHKYHCSPKYYERIKTQSSEVA